MDTSSTQSENGPNFYIGQHETNRRLPITEPALRQAQDLGYDMLTTPITTPHFHSRVLALLSSHLAQLQPIGTHSDRNQPLEQPSPIIPPLTPVDTPLLPNETISQLLAFASSWTDLCSPDPLIANISRQVLSLEVAYAAFCGIGNIIVPCPKLHHWQNHEGDGLTHYARAIQEALSIGTYLSVQIHFPMIDHPDNDSTSDDIGSLTPFARETYLHPRNSTSNRRADDFGTWDAWHVIRTFCKYSPRLFVALSIPAMLPSQAVQNRWFAEPLRLLDLGPSTFKQNRNHYPVLTRAHQVLLTRYMRLRTTPWLLLSDLPDHPSFDEPILGPNGTLDATNSHAGSSFPPPTNHLVPYDPLIDDDFSQISPHNTTTRPKSSKKRDPFPHLSYLRHLQQNQPRRSTIERFGAGYQDYLQSPLQPLTDNLESFTYEVFEKDPVKYDHYERAIALALRTWDHAAHPGSGPGTTPTLVLAVVGAGRGPLVTRALRASTQTSIPISIWAIEKNPNAYVLLQHHNEHSWGGSVNVVKSDMRAWKGPKHPTTVGTRETATYGKVDIFVSELLGSFADNELSPECLDGVTDLLRDDGAGISIPQSYTAHVTPIGAPRLHADIQTRRSSAGGDPDAAETPYVVWLHAVDYLSTQTHRTDASTTPSPVDELTQVIEQTWEFVHPPPASHLAQSALRRAGGLAGGSGGWISGSDGWNEHNARFSRVKFRCAKRGVCHGLAGFFESVLFDAGSKGGKVELSTRPDQIAIKSEGMVSWFPIYFPLKVPMYFPDGTDLVLSMWRMTDDRKVWYEWLVEAFVDLGGAEGAGDKRVRVGISELHSSRKNGCLM